MSRNRLPIFHKWSQLTFFISLEVIRQNENYSILIMRIARANGMKKCRKWGVFKSHFPLSGLDISMYINVESSVPQLYSICIGIWIHRRIGPSLEWCRQVDVPPYPQCRTSLIWTRRRGNRLKKYWGGNVRRKRRNRRW